MCFVVFKQKTAYEMRISDWSSDVCSSDLRELVAAQVDAFVLLEAVGEIFDELAVEILTAEEGVAVGRLHLEYAVANLEHRDVEGAAAKVIDRDRLVLGLVEAIGERGSGRLVDDAQHFEARDRSEESRVGKEGGSTWRSRWAP